MTIFKFANYNWNIFKLKQTKFHCRKGNISVPGKKEPLSMPMIGAKQSWQLCKHLPYMGTIMLQQSTMGTLLTS
jgi:hypothetical protein